MRDVFLTAPAYAVPVLWACYLINLFFYGLKNISLIRTWGFGVLGAERRILLDRIGLINCVALINRISPIRLVD